MPLLVPSLGLAYFPVPKNACTSLKEFFYEIIHSTPFEPRRAEDGRTIYIHNLPGYSAPHFRPEFAAATGGQARLAVVRHPVRRLVSAYKNRVMAYRELSARALGQEAMERHGLVPDPSFEVFMDRIEAYRQASASIRHHTTMQAVFLGPDLSLYEHLHRVEELPRLQALLAALAGRPVALPHRQRAGAQFPDPEITPATRRKLLEFCAPDLEYLSRFYGEG
jgi:Sulfotransferase family